MYFRSIDVCQSIFSLIQFSQLSFMYSDYQLIAVITHFVNILSEQGFTGIITQILGKFVILPIIKVNTLTICPYP